MCWPFTFQINWSSDFKKFANSQPSDMSLKSLSRSLKQFSLTVGLNNFRNKIPVVKILFKCNLIKGFGHNVLKLRYYEKATKFEKKFYRFWQNIFFYSVESKQVGDFFNFWGLWERPLMTSLIFGSFLTYLPTLSYSITSLFGGYFGPL